MYIVSYCICIFVIFISNKCIYKLCIHILHFFCRFAILHNVRTSFLSLNGEMVKGDKTQHLHFHSGSLLLRSGSDITSNVERTLELVLAYLVRYHTDAWMKTM